MTKYAAQKMWTMILLGFAVVAAIVFGSIWAIKAPASPMCHQPMNLYYFDRANSRTTQDIVFDVEYMVHLNELRQD